MYLPFMGIYDTFCLRSLSVSLSTSTIRGDPNFLGTSGSKTFLMGLHLIKMAI